MVELSAMEAELCERSDRDYSDLRAVYINCTLKRSPEVSNTQGLADRSIAVLEHLASRSTSFAPSIARSPPACGPT